MIAECGPWGLRYAASVNPYSAVPLSWLHIGDSERSVYKRRVVREFFSGACPLKITQYDSASSGWIFDGAAEWRSKTRTGTPMSFVP